MKKVQNYPWKALSSSISLQQVKKGFIGAQGHNCFLLHSQCITRRPPKNVKNALGEEEKEKKLRIFGVAFIPPGEIFTAESSAEFQDQENDCRLFGGNELVITFC